MPSARFRRKALPCALLALALALPQGARGQQDGARIFQEACAGCHGMAAQGDGPTAALLTVDVPDLTRIAWRNDGVFDAARVVRLIDGREGLAAHGGPMPLFGGLLTGPSAVLDGPEGTPVTTTEPILAIVRWLETQQVEESE